ncbi:MAG: sulfotransferase [Verrucomicrobia bacterium]|nr:sulfotransferase [Verrucomicrobiota bacterium]
MTAFEQVTRAAGRRPNVGTLLSIAERQTGLNDFGDHRFLEALAFLVESVEREAKLNALGRFVFVEHVVQLLRNRLYLELDWKLDPTISLRKIPKPVFITGLPRTGTTLLHSLLAQDTDIFAAPLTWEVIYPSAAQGDERLRIRRTESQLKWFELLVPGLKAIHPVAAELPQECVAIMSHCFMSEEFDTMFDLPGYESWVEAQDQRELYAFHKRFLQHLRRGAPERRFVLKAPAHLRAVEAILDVYPDAHTIHTHRHPAQVVPSLSSLIVTLKGAFSYNINPIEAGPGAVDYCVRNMRKFFSTLDRLSANACTDVAYLDLVRNPMAVVRQIYARLGEQLSAEAEAKMERFLAENPQGKWGRHKYSLADFGLQPEAIDEQFRFYTERYDMDARPSKKTISK